MVVLPASILPVRARMDRYPLAMTNLDLYISIRRAKCKAYMSSHMVEMGLQTVSTSKTAQNRLRNGVIRQRNGIMLSARARHRGQSWLPRTRPPIEATDHSGRIARTDRLSPADDPRHRKTMSSLRSLRRSKSSECRLESSRISFVTV